ncbi:MAG: hypothetical protein Q7R96_05915 [Nanoarchaeota archaeon]|nr:hypothetical protein [Nanoarchaeota archaeon]
MTEYQTRSIGRNVAKIGALVGGLFLTGLYACEVSERGTWNPIEQIQAIRRENRAAYEEQQAYNNVWREMKRKGLAPSDLEKALKAE